MSSKLFSNQGECQHTLLSCTSVSLKDQVTIRCKKLKEDVVSNISLGPGDCIDIEVELVPK